MKFVIAWLTLRPGKRGEFMALAQPFAAATRQEDGVVFFEFHHDATNPDGVVAVECYRDHAAHEAHWTTPHFAAMWTEVQRLAVEGRFQNIFADRVEPDAAVFPRSAP